MENKNVILTGSASGIGLATANLLLSQGANVFGIDIHEAPASLTASNKYKHHVANISSRDTIPAAIDACRQQFGPNVDALLNVAGVMDHFASADGMTDGDLDRCIGVNLVAPILLMRAVVPIMLSQPNGGSIVNVASSAGFSGAWAGLAYTSSKHGLVGATRNVAWRFRQNNIRCNCICPGTTVTNIGQSMDKTQIDKEVYGDVMSLIGTVRRTGPGQGQGMQPDKLASAIVFLASDAASGINGAVVPVDGGICAL